MTNQTIGGRRGSALLIVLGMVAFMIVSAVGFAAYMRYSRLPSSYLRRGSSVRLMAKAALARAMSEIDGAIGNNPHPNVGGGALNVWEHRVFLGTNALLSADATVSPLCFEALAYIPPPLVNEARYYSRLTPTAQWHSLNFDVGRYVWCALDVSDYFDVNRIMADAPRSSAASRRVSMSYLFENTHHTAPGTGGEAWDNFLNEFRNCDPQTKAIDFDGKYPLISLADFNLALGQKGEVAGFRSCFYDYANGSSGTRAGFYDTGSEEDEERIRRMTFVTDGWFPLGRRDYDPESEQNGGNRNRQNQAEEDELLDIGKAENQPFTMATLNLPKTIPSNFLLNNGAQSDDWPDHLSLLGCACLYDYLDGNHEPLSLALPTAERHPMVTGLKLVMPGTRFAIRKEPGEDKEVGKAANSRMMERTVRYVIDANGLATAFRGGMLQAMVTFPFNHKDDADGSFVLDGRVAFFFSTANLGLRTKEVNDIIHNASATFPDSGIDPATSIANVKLIEQPVSFADKKIKSEEDAIRVVRMMLTGGAGIPSQLQMAGNEVLSVTYRWPQTCDRDGNWGPSFEKMVSEPGSSANITAANGIKPLNERGQLDERFTSEKLKETIDAGVELKLNIAVWMRVRNSSGKVVDMVPACLTDDQYQNNNRDPLQTAMRVARVGGAFSGADWPLLRFDTGVKFNFNLAGLDGMSAGVDAGNNLPCAMIGDPRFNYAPEHWFAGNWDLTAEEWLKRNGSGTAGHDSDIFMATSDAGYLQSVYELAFLPAFTDLRTFGNDAIRGNFESIDTANRVSLAGSFNEALNNRFQWCTFDPIDRNEQAFNELPWTSEGTGFKVNPYSDSTNILMAAFANTPLDWKRCSTNVVRGGVDYTAMSVAEFNKNYAFNGYSSDTRIIWEDLERIAGHFSDVVRQKRNWLEAFNSLNWYSSEYLAGVPVEELDDNTDEFFSADRKFLYGYWRDCFATSQQLFLIFVRAEPMMMGSGNAQQIPPQLGARAVALVWRDPHQTKDGAPHQMRVLFYRQFD